MLGGLHRISGVRRLRLLRAINTDELLPLRTPYPICIASSQLDIYIAAGAETRLPGVGTRETVKRRVTSPLSAPGPAGRLIC